MAGSTVYAEQASQDDRQFEGTGAVFDIQRYAVEDGPGIRTIVFLKGCPLRCDWCANPEAQERKPQVIYYQKKCQGCGHCVTRCPQKAIRVDSEFGLVTDSGLCSGCGLCVDACYYSARRLIGTEMSIDAVFEVVEKDRMFYDTSGGGVTISGGEPLLQWAFVRGFLQRCKDASIHTALETSGFAPWDALECLVPYLDLVFYDIKHIDKELHRKYTGVDNKLIISNLRKLDQVFSQIIVRVPFIPGYNDDIEVQRRIYEIASCCRNVQRVEVLPYHRLGLTKYRGLGWPYKLEALLPVNKGDLSYLVDVGKQAGVTVQIGAS